jgi:hypothetical protein
MTQKLFPLTDPELAGSNAGGPISYEELRSRYRDMRDHYLSMVEAQTKRDRSAILRMAGNIAGGFCADPTYEAEFEDIAERAVHIARAIVIEVDKCPMPPYTARRD